MDLTSSISKVEIEIPSLLTRGYNLAIYVLSLLFLLCYQYPKVTFFSGMLLSYIVLSTILDAIVGAFFTTPVNRFPLVVALILAAVAWYLHLLIKEYDDRALVEAVRAAELAAVEQLKFLDAEDESGTESEISCDGDDDGLTGTPRGRAMTGGLDLDVWQGGDRTKRRGWTPKKA
ncbi:hypothetical protein BKA65DRAFT_474940 [Rhexocercosporidium sp. MPI-PUGE-AT-0058]|nr:hypothetical protein BKA65DRAFT_474940 [Rhexocercosporidium sp. MPI-PUGE-AT-0058]